MTPTLRAKLEESPSAISLRGEQTAYKTLAKLNWSCQQGAFYTDARENKLREMDIVARQVWQEGRRPRNRVVRLNLVIEVKSVKDWQIIFAGRHNGQLDDSCARVWSGFLDDKSAWLDRALEEGGVPLQALPALRGRFESLAFPREVSSMNGLFPSTPQLAHAATAFRETNTDKEKDLDGSVLWRAISALRSAVEALKQEVHEWHADMFTALTSATPFAAYNFHEEFDRTCEVSSRFVDVFHPIVVIDSGLWRMASSGRLRAIDSCRFIQSRANGATEWWVDVINSSHLDERLSEISNHYGRFLRMRKMRRT